MGSPGVVPAIEPVKKEFNWKRLFIKAAGVGAGFALMLAILVGAVVWHSNRPKPPKPWNGNAITAAYRNLNVEQDQKINFLCTLTNNTDYDFRIGESEAVELAMKLDNADTYADFGHYAKIDLPIFIPAHKKTIAVIHFEATYPSKLKADATEDEREKYRSDVEEFLRKKEIFTGFVLLHEATRYKIDFPPDWNKPSSKGK